MSARNRIVVIVAALAVFAGLVVLRESRRTEPQAEDASLDLLPRLVDLGSTTCVPCKRMAPILEELGREFRGRMIVEFIDVHKDPDAAERYGVRVIPTQVFLDPLGMELYRHEGFFSREQILETWDMLGVDLGLESSAAGGRGAAAGAQDAVAGGRDTTADRRGSANPGD